MNKRRARNNLALGALLALVSLSMGVASVAYIRFFMSLPR